MPRVPALPLLLCAWLGAVSHAQGWKISLQSQNLENFDRNIDAFWMSQQGVLFLAPGRIVVYQVRRTTEPARLGPRDDSGGAGNFVLDIKALSVDDGHLLKALALPTSGTISAVTATRDGQFLVRTGSMLRLYSKDFELLASRALRAGKEDGGEGWQVKVSPSGREVVVLHEREIPNPAPADNGAAPGDDDAQGSVDVLDAHTLLPQRTFVLARVPLFWVPADERLLSSNPSRESEKPVGLLDYDGKWSPLPAGIERAGSSCRSSVRPMDLHRLVVYGCDAFSVLSADGTRLFSRNDERFIFRSVVAGGSYLAAACDHYRLRGDAPDGNVLATTRPDRIEVYDLDRHVRLLSFRVRGLRIYYAISLEGDLAVIDGASLEIIRTRR